ncbi:hypothetical protein M9Y10_034839 [Tritrichomonas musculus]|uniref:Uncharacterized protein n=1 Tax=Tritrichomonas musculus TaxID=1915356 RepID=A0ABR2KG24_9EUKA
MNDDEIFSNIEKLSKYSTFQIKNFPKSINQKIYNVYMKNLRLSRGTFHMEMLIAALNYNSDNPNDTLFIVPPIMEFFKDIFSEPLKMMQCYPAMFNQKIVNLIGHIYLKPSEFAKIVFNFFKNDSSHLLLFAYTTFPSIFDMFIGEEFCQCALEFLLTILDLAKAMETEIIENLKKQRSGKLEKINWNQIVLTFFPSKICDAFISSFFCGAPGFYETFWTNLSQRLFKYNKKPPFKHLFDATLNSLNDALPYLTKYHIAAITKYSSTLPQRCTKFFTEKLILQPFLRESVSSTLFSSANMNNAYIDFLNELMSPIRLAYAEQLLNMVIINKKFLSITPKMQPSNIWSHGLPLILNDNDIFTLYKMMQYSKTFTFTYTTNDIVFSEDYRPIIIDIYPSFLKQKKVDTEIMKGLFGRHPPSFSFKQNNNSNSNNQNSNNINNNQNAKNDIHTNNTQNDGNSNNNHADSENLHTSNNPDINNNETQNNNNNNNNNQDLSQTNIKENQNNKIFLTPNRNQKNFSQKNKEIEQNLSIIDDSIDSQTTEGTIVVTENFPENYISRWGHLKTYVNNKIGADIATFYTSPTSNSFFRDTRFKRYAGYQILNEFSNSFDSIEQTILLYEHHASLKEIGDLISLHNITLYHHLSVDFFKKRIHTHVDLYPTLREFFLSETKSSKRLLLVQSPSSSSSNLVVESLSKSPISTIYHKNTASASSKRITFPGKVCFEISCVALDCTHFHCSSKMKEAQIMFMKLLNSWMEKEWPEQSRICHFNNKIKYVLDASTLLGQLNSVGLGKKLKIILNFQRRLQVILGRYWDKDWSIIFNYAIYAASAPIVFAVFLTLHHFIFTDNDVVAGWGKSIHSTWGLFSAGMWYVMKRNPSFCSFCSNIDECKQLFMLDK